MTVRQEAAKPETGRLRVVRQRVAKPFARHGRAGRLPVPPAGGDAPEGRETDARMALSVRGYLAGWKVLRTLPAAQAYFLGALAADATWRRRGTGVRRLEKNLSLVGVAPGAVPQMTRAAMRSYLRYWCEVFRVASWSREQVLASVRVVGDEPVRAAIAQGRGVVMALAHQGNWDLAGAWSTYALAPVTTVAERLEPPEVFDSFLAFRRKLGMTVYPLGEPNLTGLLVRALKNGHIVPLLADRDLAGTGQEVDLFGRTMRFAAGPAVLADLTGAALVPVNITYEQVAVDERGWPESGYRTVITFHPEVDLGGGNRKERVRRGVEGYATALGAGIAATPADWHMLQPVFGEDTYAAPRTPRRRRRRRRG